MSSQSAEGGIDQVDARERRRIDAGLPQQYRTLRTLFRSVGIAAAQLPGDRVGKGFEAGGTHQGHARLRGRRQQRMAGFELLVKHLTLQHPAVVVAGMDQGGVAGRGGKAADAGGQQLPLAGARAGLVGVAPAAGRVDRDDPGAHPLAAPVADLLHLAARELAGEATRAEGHGMKALAPSAYVDAHHREVGVGLRGRKAALTEWWWGGGAAQSGQAPLRPGCLPQAGVPWPDSAPAAGAVSRFTAEKARPIPNIVPIAQVPLRGHSAISSPPSTAVTMPSSSTRPRAGP